MSEIHVVDSVEKAAACLEDVSNQYFSDSVWQSMAKLNADFPDEIRLIRERGISLMAMMSITKDGKFLSLDKEIVQLFKIIAEMAFFRGYECGVASKE